MEEETTETNREKALKMAVSISYGRTDDKSSETIIKNAQAFYEFLCSK